MLMAWIKIKNEVVKFGKTELSLVMAKEKVCC